MRLIDADKLMQMIPTEECNARIAITYAPTVDAEIVRHGRWISHDYDFAPAESTQECSVCHKEQPIYMVDDNYCPNCGAKMDGERREDA